MKLRYIETLIPAEVLAAHPDLDLGRMLVIQIDEGDPMEITVQGYGTGAYLLSVRALRNSTHNPAGTLADLFQMPGPWGHAQFGAAGVWGSPETIAHLVWDCIRNA